MAAGSPATPAPITTTSADRSQLRCEPLWALASRALAAANAAPAAPVDRKARRLTSPEAAPARSVVFLSMFPPGRFKSHQMLIAGVRRTPLAGKTASYKLPAVGATLVVARFALPTS